MKWALAMHNVYRNAQPEGPVAAGLQHRPYLGPITAQLSKQHGLQHRARETCKDLCCRTVLNKPQGAWSMSTQHASPGARDGGRLVIVRRYEQDVLRFQVGVYEGEVVQEGSGLEQLPTKLAHLDITTGRKHFSQTALLSGTGGTRLQFPCPATLLKMVGPARALRYKLTVG